MLRQLAESLEMLDSEFNISIAKWWCDGNNAIVKRHATDFKACISTWHFSDGGILRFFRFYVIYVKN